MYYILVISRRGELVFLSGNRKNLAEERIVRILSSPGSMKGVPYLCNDWC